MQGAQDIVTVRFQGGAIEEVFLGEVTWSLGTDSAATAAHVSGMSPPPRIPRRKRTGAAALDGGSSAEAPHRAKQPRISERVRQREAQMAHRREAEQLPVQQPQEDGPITSGRPRAFPQMPTMHGSPRSIKAGAAGVEASWRTLEARHEPQRPAESSPGSLTGATTVQRGTAAGPGNQRLGLDRSRSPPAEFTAMPAPAGTPPPPDVSRLQLALPAAASARAALASEAGQGSLSERLAVLSSTATLMALTQQETELSHARATMVEQARAIHSLVRELRQLRPALAAAEQARSEQVRYLMPAQVLGCRVRHLRQRLDLGFRVRHLRPALAAVEQARSKQVCQLRPAQVLGLGCAG
jgi:hypothetical protein